MSIRSTGNVNPVSTLKLKETPVEKPKFPVIDVHNHFGFAKPGELDNIIEIMDEYNFKAVINLDGQTGDKLRENIENYQNRYPGRIYTFIYLQQIENRGQKQKMAGKIQDLVVDIDDNNFTQKMRNIIKEGIKMGARGIKLVKDLGISIKDSKGNLVLPDDDRLRVIWETAAEEDVPVLYHVADPVAKFMPPDEKNPMYEKLTKKPHQSFYGPGFPTHKQLLDSHRRLIDKNPETYFIFPHMFYAEDLDYVSGLMDSYTNFSLDISAKQNILGKQPYTSRKFFIKHADRILFGEEGYPSKNVSTGKLQTVCRFLETDDEYFYFLPGSYLYGLYLPDDVLKKVYHENIERILNI